jgi:DNA-binding beta-propeller fold protein YncE
MRNVAVEQDDYDYGVLLSAEYLKGTLYVLNMPENSYDLLRLPVQVLNAIRRPFIKELQAQLDGPGGVAMYMFGPKQYVLYNMSDQTASLSLRFENKIPASGWSELVHGKQLTISEDTSYVRFDGPVVSNVALTLQPFEITIVQAP